MNQTSAVNKFDFKVSDTVRVTFKESPKGKTHFEGVVIACRGEGPNQTFMVRKIATGGVAVERIFPLNSPNIEEIKIVKKGNRRRAKLYYLRQRR